MVFGGHAYQTRGSSTIRARRIVEVARTRPVYRMLRWGQECGSRLTTVAQAKGLRQPIYAGRLQRDRHHAARLERVGGKTLKPQTGPVQKLKPWSVQPRVLHMTAGLAIAFAMAGARGTVRTPTLEYLPEEYRTRLFRRWADAD